MTTIAILFKNIENGNLFVANNRDEAENFIKSNWGEEAYSLKYLRDIYDWNCQEVSTLNWKAKKIEF